MVYGLFAAHCLRLVVAGFVGSYVDEAQNPKYSVAHALQCSNEIHCQVMHKLLCKE